MIIETCEQNTTQWLNAKAGKVSSSNFDKIVTMKGEASKQQEAYMFQLAGETIVGTREDSYKSAAMENGLIREEEAANLYELHTGADLEKIGMCYKDETRRVSSSPDRLVGEDGLLEIKCPLIHTAVKYLVANKTPSAYFQQLQGQLYVTGRKWVDFMSYYPSLKPLIIRVERDEAFITALDFELKLFIAQLDKVIEKIK